MTKKAIERVIDLLVTATDETLLMSRKNCHARHISSIVLRNDNGQLTRMFMAWPQHGLWEYGDSKVGVHNHLYDISLKLVHGDVLNYIWYKYTPDSDEYDESYYDYENFRYTLIMRRHYKFESGVVSGHPIIYRQENCGIGIKSKHRKLTKNKWTHLDHDILHDIVCKRKEKSAWLVREGKQQKTMTDLYVEEPFKFETDLYQKFETKDEVIDHVMQFFKDII